MRAALRQLGVGRWMERHVFRPTIGLRWKLSLGVRPAAQIIFGEMRMRAAARRLPVPLSPPEARPFPCAFMTGKKFWHQTAFCAYTLAVQLGRPLVPSIYDDGTLLADQAAVLRRLFPQSRVISRSEAETEVQAGLPPTRFPAIHATRQVSVMMRKFVDQRATSHRWQLYLDSDMLFVRRPDWLEGIADSGRAACYMADVWDAYLRPVEMLDAMCGRPIIRRLNAGLVGLDDALIDWDRVESWCQKFTGAERAGNVVEQTLTAMLLAWLPASEPAPAADYSLHKTFSPSSSRAALVHYVEAGKGIYAANEWRRAGPA